MDYNNNITKEKITRYACAISKTIPPKGEYITFSDDAEKIAVLKTFKLLTPSASSLKNFFYNGVFAASCCKCEILGYKDDVIIIDLDGQLHCINSAHLLDMQISEKSEADYNKFSNTVPIFTNGIYEFITSNFKKCFENSPYKDMVTTNLNLNRSTSVIFSGKKIFDCTPQKQKIVLNIRNDFWEDINNIDFPIAVTITNTSTDFYKLSINNTQTVYKPLIEFIFQSCEKYVDDHYVPDYFFDCCSRYMECSDSLKCVNPDYLHSKGCTYRKKLESGIIFFGKNQNI